MEFRDQTACFDDVLLVPGKIRPTCGLVTAKRSRKPWGRSRISSLPVKPDWASSAASTAFRLRCLRERFCAGSKLSFGAGSHAGGEAHGMCDLNLIKS